jgi:hypothetical protein
MIDMSAQAISARLRRAASESDLSTPRRLSYKLDMSSRGITRRLRKVEALRRLCLELGRIGRRNGGAATR